MRLKKVFLSLMSAWLLSALQPVLAQNTTTPSTQASASEMVDDNQESQELLELKGRLRSIESMLMAQKDRENELLRDLNKMMLASQEEPEETVAEEAKQEIAAMEQRFEMESAALQTKIQQLEVALAAGQERDLQMGQEMNKTILVTVSIVAGVGLLVFLVTVYLQYRLISRPVAVQPVYMPPPGLAIEGGPEQMPEEPEPSTAEPETGLVENSNVKDTNEKFTSAVEQLEERIRNMEAGLSRADEVLNATEDAEVEIEESFTDPSSVSENQIEDAVLVEESVLAEEPIEFGEAVSEVEDEPMRELDDMDVAVLEEEGRRFLQKEQWSTALQYFDQLVKLDGSRVDNWVNRGRALEMLNREEEAISSYDQAIQVNPDLPSPFLYKAALLSRLERFEEAQKFYNTALSKVPVQKSEQTAVAS